MKPQFILITKNNMPVAALNVQALRKAVFNFEAGVISVMTINGALTIEASRYSMDNVLSALREKYRWVRSNQDRLTSGNMDANSTLAILAVGDITTVFFPRGWSAITRNSTGCVLHETGGRTHTFSNNAELSMSSLYPEFLEGCVAVSCFG